MSKAKKYSKKEKVTFSLRGNLIEFKELKTKCLLKINDKKIKVYKEDGLFKTPLAYGVFEDIKSLSRAILSN